MRSRLVLLLLISLPLFTCCATTKEPTQPSPPEPVATYQIPVIKANGQVHVFTVEPQPGDTERMLFCIESPEIVMCVAEEGGREKRYYFPAPPSPNSEL